MRGVLKWGAIAFVALVVLGALVGEDDGADNGGDSAQEQSSAPAETTPDATPDPTPEPTPEPTVAVSFSGPDETTSDVVKLRGFVKPKAGKVRVRGAKVKRNGRAWSAMVGVERGENSFKIAATLPGAKPHRMTAVVTRKLSAAEKAAAREAARQAFMAEAQAIPYNQLEKNPREYKGTKVVMRGQIFQIQEDYGFTWMLLSVTDEGYGFWTDNVWVEYAGEITGAEEDIITVYGTVKGAKSYETQIGGETYVPKVQAEYIVE